MSFTDVTFLFVFLPISIVLYILIDNLFHRIKLNNLVLVVLSLLFYLWSDKNSVIVVTTIVLFSFAFGQLLEKNRTENVDDDSKKRISLPIIVLVGALAIYKYLDTVIRWINNSMHMDSISAIKLIAPIGISFIIFESVSYLIDIYRGDEKAGSLLDCFTYFLLFPKIVSGPVVLWKDLGPQLKKRRSTVGKISKGIDRIIVGYAKKVIISDSFGNQIVLINNAFSIDVPTMWLKALLYFFQIYYDFSGYSDIAIGLCMVFGFEIKENFNHPYLSSSITEFWRRWHISLGTWFREYVYIPLGGNKRGNVYVHLLIVFALTGLWHGTGMQLLIWGLLHGAFVVIERMNDKKGWYSRTPTCIKWALTVTFVFLTWILFMSSSMAAAIQSYKQLFVPVTKDTVNYTWRYFLSGRIQLLMILAIVDHIFGTNSINVKIKPFLDSTFGITLKRVGLLLLFIVDILFVVSSTYSLFIYFQF